MTSNQSALTQNEKKVLNKALKQTLIPIALYALILLITCSIVVIGLQKVNSTYNIIYIQLSIFIVPSILFALISYKTLIPLIKDLLSKDKISCDEIIIDKKINTNYGWSGNPIENQINKPFLTEHHLIFGNSTINIDKNKFDKLNIGDEITIYKSMYSNVTLGIV